MNDAQGQPITCERTKADCFTNYFVTAISNLKSEIDICHNDNCNTLRTLSQSPNRFVLKTSVLTMYLGLFLDMDTNKYPGDDNISPKFVRESREEINPILGDIFNKMVNN